MTLTDKVSADAQIPQTNTNFDLSSDKTAKSQKVDPATGQPTDGWVALFATIDSTTASHLKKNVGTG